MGFLYIQRNSSCLSKETILEMDVCRFKLILEDLSEFGRVRGISEVPGAQSLTGCGALGRRSPGPTRKMVDSKPAASEAWRLGCLDVWMPGHPNNWPKNVWMFGW